ncbi:MAG: thioredoxin family protein [Labilibaculum sp.]|nr:thioredoxin domain-containing protein [Labilibaculum sp.]MBI9057205.1 thioredoxin family protein [Labilibaculum sp.]
MKKIFGVLVALLICGNVFSQGIEFEYIGFQQALDKAKAENKMVFMDCYTTWCGPCKALAKNVFPQKEVGEYYNANFINLKMDMEKGEGPELLKKYDVKGFPTLLFIDADGNVLYKRVGGGSAKDLITDAKKATDPTERIDYVKKKYEEGDRSEEIVMKYIGLLAKNKLKEELKKVGIELLAGFSNEDLLDPAKFETYRVVGDVVDSERFKFVLDNKNKFIAISNEEAVNDFIMNIYVENIRSAVGGTDIEKLNTAVELFETKYPDPQNYFFNSQSYDKFYLENKNFEAWFESKEKAAEGLVSGEKQYQNVLIMAGYRVAQDPIFDNVEGAYTKAENWFRQVVKFNENYVHSYSGLAYLYQKMNQKEEALKNVLLSIKKSKEQGHAVDQRILDLQKSIEEM